MRSLFLCGTFVLGGVVVICSAGLAQNAPAGQPPAQANPPAGAQSNPPQQGMGRGPAPPVQGPPHDPHDLAGVWNTRRGYGGNSYDRQGPEFTPWGQEQFKLAKASNGGQYTLQQTNDPVTTKCFPPGVPRIYLQPFPLQFVQTPKEVIILYEYDHTVRHVLTDGRKHPDDLTPTYMGDSIGRWDGDTFVVDTIGFNDKTWLDRAGRPHSDQLHVVERFQRMNLNDLELDITMEDPKALAKPWNAHIGFQLHPDWSIAEQVCADNGDFVSFEK
ncbi:MAG: hypothetical protein DMG30_00430 [Acidobacteria bacterium]|nr:MAG: hypothetical protein DMG30_00430 [Acidobacteriota bacterium]